MDFESTAQLLGNLGEFVGAIAVVVTLVYLVAQIRDSRRSTNAATLASVIQSFNQLNASIGGDEEVARIWERGAANPEDLEPLDQTRYFMLARQAVNLYWTLFLLHKQGMIAPDVWHPWDESAKQFFRIPGVKEFMQIHFGLVDPDFSAYCESAWGTGEWDGQMFVRAKQNEGDGLR